MPPAEVAVQGPLRLLLVLMVKNESRILRRCLTSAAPFVDAILVVDTGSSDETVALAEAFDEAPIAVAHVEWQNFGYSRTASLEAARRHARGRGWELARTYALVLDADMRLRGSPVELRALLTTTLPSGALLLQSCGTLEYANMRLLRLSDAWFCEGVTHEYWTGGGQNSITVPKQVVDIDDVGDGGAKSDKFMRDERLLLQGLEEHPDNVRYLFYLAQTYHCMGQHEKAQPWYERRIAAGGWWEEVWYSHFMIVRGLLARGLHEEAEIWVNKAWLLDPTRPEARLAMVSYYRERSRHYEAWAHLLHAERCVYPNHPRLFLERDAYDERPTFERSVLAYYVLRDRAPGVAACLAYRGPLESLALQNLSWYAEPLSVLQSTRLTFPVPGGYSSSSVACDPHGDRLVVRTVSYTIAATGAYVLPSGKVETRNFASTWREGVGWEGFDEMLPPAAAPRRTPETILGLEDVRCCNGACTATTREFSYCDANRIVYWRAFGTPAGAVAAFRCLRPPQGETCCEKNWIPVGQDDLLIYGWHPFQLGRVTFDPENAWTGGLDICLEHATPSAFRHYRGSSPPFLVGAAYWIFVHVVCPHAPRHYLHVLVELAKDDWRPLAASDPFYFRRKGIEYCLGARLDASGERLDIFHSVNDGESWHSQASVTACRALLKAI